jgi:ornithine lipid ester-linked acyl 2-hydroxylase
MLERLRRFAADPKRLTHFTDGLCEAFAKAEDAGWFARAPAFIHDYHADYPGLAELEAGYADVRRECESLLALRHKMIDVEALAGKYTSGGIHARAWKAFMLKSHRFLEPNCALAPRTTELLRGVRGLYTAFFSILDADQTIPPHWGYWKGFLRYHLAVIVPNDNADHACRLRVNANADDNAKHDISLIDRGEPYFWREGRGVMFDDTFLHDAHNHSNAVRVVLWLDLRRKLPAHLHAVNTMLLEIAHRSPQVARIQRNAIVA